MADSEAPLCGYNNHSEREVARQGVSQWGKWHSQSVSDARGPEHFNVTLGILINCK